MTDRAGRLPPGEELGDHPLSRKLLAAFYGLAGIGHFLLATPLLSIMPAWVPFPALVIAATGVIELVAAVLVLSPRLSLRRFASVGLALYAIAVTPANVQHMLNDLGRATAVLGLWYHIPRLMLQPLLVLWPLHACGLLHGTGQKRTPPAA